MMRRLLFACVALLAMVAIVSASAVITGRFAHNASADPGRFNWELFALILTGLGTTALAVATGALALSTWQDVRATTRMANTVVEQAKADRTPLVYPVAPFEWAAGRDPYLDGRDSILVVRNGGRGIGRRVRGSIIWDDGKGRQAWPSVGILSTTLAAGETQDVRLDGTVGSWARAYGALDYEDTAGTLWRTYFEFNLDARGQAYVDVRQMDERWRTGDMPEQRVDSDDWQPGPPFPPDGPTLESIMNPARRERFRRWREHRRAMRDYKRLPFERYDEHAEVYDSLLEVPLDEVDDRGRKAD